MLAATLLAFVLTVALTPLAILLLRRLHAYDVPTERSSHVAHTLRGGGMAVAVGAVAGLLLGGWDDAASLTTLLVAVSILAVVGLIDDLRGLEVMPRLSAELIGALLCLPWLLKNLTMPWGWRLLVAVAAVVWVMGFVNSFNFMDGINGISSMFTVVAGGTFFLIGEMHDLPLVSTSGAVVAAAALGFLPFNFPRARVFLGDVGSYFLGGWLAFTVLVIIVSGVPPEAALAPLAIYLADTGFTLIRRVASGRNWWESHHEHVYQRLIDRGWSHGGVDALVVLCSLACAALGMASLTPSLIARVAGDFAVLALAAAYLSVPAVLAARDRHRAPVVQRSKSPA